MAMALEVLAFVATVLVGGSLALAGITKLVDKRRFEQALKAYQFLPAPAARAVVKVLPPVEVLLGIGVASGMAPVYFGGAAGVLLVAFTSATVLAFRNGESVDCGCFGDFFEASTLRKVVARNLSLTILAVVPVAVGYASPTAATSATSVLIALAAVLVTLVLATRASSAPVQQVAPVESSPRLGRRDLLGRALQIGAGGLAATFLAGKLNLGVAEAACSYCGSCGNDVVWIACAGNCCAAFWVRDLKYCSGPCYSCSAWRIETYCGYYECC